MIFIVFQVAKHKSLFHKFASNSSNFNLDLLEQTVYLSFFETKSYVFVFSAKLNISGRISLLLKSKQEYPHVVMSSKTCFPYIIMGSFCSSNLILTGFKVDLLNNYYYLLNSYYSFVQECTSFTLLKIQPILLQNETFSALQTIALFQ